MIGAVHTDSTCTKETCVCGLICDHKTLRSTCVACLIDKVETCEAVQCASSMRVHADWRARHNAVVDRYEAREKVFRDVYDFAALSLAFGGFLNGMETSVAKARDMLLADNGSSRKDEP